MENELRQWRRAAGLTQSQVAKALGLRSASTVCMWENGARRPRVDRLIILADLYGCTVDQLLKRR